VTQARRGSVAQKSATSATSSGWSINARSSAVGGTGRVLRIGVSTSPGERQMRRMPVDGLLGVEAAAQRGHRVLGSHVARPGNRCERHARLRGDMDDSSVAAGTHYREGGEGAIEHRLEVDHLGDASRGEIAPVALLDIAAGGIDEDERVAERRHDFRMGRRDRPGIGDVGRSDYDFTGRSVGPDRRLLEWRQPPAGQGDARAGAGEGNRTGAANAGAGAGAGGPGDLAMEGFHSRALDRFVPGTKHIRRSLGGCEGRSALGLSASRSAIPGASRFRGRQGRRRNCQSSYIVRSFLASAAVGSGFGIGSGPPL
jgi:hypothetical protein